ncbi:MAG: ArsR family transcriptional regulator [Acidobacteria bacterium]|nr:MAG: ArsR family transcriptional regulator [Acidobacteriota bacterium]REK02032.1 MAG: ArsR family transcriptional regulator [Acidobacteriota bacterium]REK14990.1 MAG: ArsR family transcriptional regulator [Acidobacteriota bacterium]REK45704.1 MAG: ArsR family transcriptional regulator [Acidobacteriota bacterium]
MANKKLSPEAITRVAERFKLLSEPVRLQILHALQDGPLSVNELTESVNTSQPNVSKHLKMLLDAGVLSRERAGNTAFYEIADASIFELCETVCGSLERRMRSEAEIFG